MRHSGTNSSQVVYTLAKAELFTWILSGPHTLMNLPSCELIFAAYCLKILRDIMRWKRLDLSAILSLNEPFDALHVPAPLFLWYWSFIKANLIVIKEARSGRASAVGRVRHMNVPCEKHGHPARDWICSVRYYSESLVRTIAQRVRTSNTDDAV